VFGLFASQERKMRQNAANWIDLADKVWSFRRDQLSAAEAAGLTERREELRRHLRERADAAKLKLGIEALEGALRRAGGAVYPKSSLTENIEFFLVAAIVILGIRTYFVQPFKIPTNSMWPTYYGMTYENFPPGGAAPGPVARVVRFAALGATRHEVIAPVDGEVSALFVNANTLAYTKARGRKWLIFPTDVKVYTFYVDGHPAKVSVPYDFSGVDEVFTATMGGRPAIEAAERNAEQSGRIVRDEFAFDTTGDSPAFAQGYRVPLGRTVAAGQPIIRFDLLTGDQLFVDRFSTHFMRPRVGQGFVFRTDEIAGIGKSDYYIKRLVGTPGDTIEIRPPGLFRNGRPIQGADAFDSNARRIAPYTGYTTVGPVYQPPDGSALRSTFMPDGKPIRVPAGFYFALGDNSSNSEDGRYWGLVPADAVIGRPLFIYYPFSRRWGPAR
jgi:signal peptidase I